MFECDVCTGYYRHLFDVLFAQTQNVCVINVNDQKNCLTSEQILIRFYFILFLFFLFCFNSMNLLSHFSLHLK